MPRYSTNPDAPSGTIAQQETVPPNEDFKPDADVQTLTQRVAALEALGGIGEGGAETDPIATAALATAIADWNAALAAHAAGDATQAELDAATASLSAAIDTKQSSATAATDAELAAALLALNLDALANVSAGSPADGQSLIYDDDLDLWIAGTPIAPGKEIAYAENVTGVVTTAAHGGGSVDIPNCSIVIPATAEPVWIEGAAFLAQSVAGTGAALVDIFEVGAGSASNADVRPLPNSTAAQLKNIGTLRPKFRLGPTVAPRTFKLRVSVTGAPAGQTPSVAASNLATLGGFQSWIRATAE
jgi:hypothetical protein